MLRKPSRTSLINRIEHVLQLSVPFSKNTFTAELAKEGIAVVFRENNRVLPMVSPMLITRPKLF
jgi:hypothetical protein